MLRKKYCKVIATAMVVTCLVSGGVFEKVNYVMGSPTTVYADTSSFNPGKVGMSTPTGWVTSKITCKDNIPENLSLEEMKKKAIKADASITTNTGGLAIGNMNLTDNIYYFEMPETMPGLKSNIFVKVLSMRVKEDNNISGKMVIERTYTMLEYISFEGLDDVVIQRNLKHENDVKNNNDVKWIEYIQNESKVTTPTEPEKPAPNPTPTDPVKKYSASRLGGSNRYLTATSVAKQVNGNKLDSVVIANAYDFPDALTGTTLAGQKNAPILLVGSEKYNNITLDYLKANLKSNGTVYLLGGNGVVTDQVVSKIKSLGFNNIKRLGGADRYVTNMAIVNELNVPKGTDIVIANSHSYPDSLSISGVAGGKNMPIFLVNDTLTSTVENKIKSIAPKNIYIVGESGVVNSNIEKKLKSYGNVVRLGGPTRYETSLKIASYFTSPSQTTAAIAYSHDFPDALTGGVIASKTSSPVILVNGDAKNQKAFLDKTKISKLYILGGTGVISDATVKQLTK